MISQAQLDQILQQVAQIENGFLPIRAAAEQIAQQSDAAQTEAFAQQLLDDARPPIRMLSTLLLGHSAAERPSSLALLREHVSQDADWRVQEILAQAFDAICARIGYAQALPLIDSWLADPAVNVRRAVTEGLRIWTSRPFFKQQPEQAIQRLSPLRADASEYLRKSVGNALRDISRKHPELIRAELSGWELTEPGIRQTYRLASKFLGRR